MTNEEKELLRRDLCARLPYGVKGLHRGQVHELFAVDGRGVNSACIQVDDYDAWFSVDTFKPYLRPMSSMTDEEEKEYNEMLIHHRYYDLVLEEDIPDYIDWFHSHHFDYRGLIEKGFALEAPAGLYYKTEQL